MLPTVEITDLPEVMIITPNVYGDDRGFFYESYNDRNFEKAIGMKLLFVQDNHSKSSKGVLRGLHYQIRHSQGKLVRALEGVIFDVAVDIRKSSPTFGRWIGVELSAENKKQLWVPPDFAHGFLVLSESAQVLYKTTDYYCPDYERSIRWDDSDLNIEWPIKNMVISLSSKDENASSFMDADLPVFRE